MPGSKLKRAIEVRATRCSLKAMGKKDDVEKGDWREKFVERHTRKKKRDSAEKKGSRRAPGT